MEGSLDEDIQASWRRYMDTLTREQMLAMLLEDSSDDDDETQGAIQDAQELFSDREGQDNQDQVQSRTIETPEQALALSDLMRSLSSRNRLANAAATGSSIAVAQLLDDGHNVNYKDGKGETAVYVAAVRGYSQVVAQLLDAGADINLAEDTKAWSPLHALAQAGNQAMIELLLARGAYPGTRDKASWTPLHVACLYGHIGCVETLIKGGADAEAADRQGRKPIHVAVDFGQEATIRLLVANGVALDRKDTEGATPLHLAVEERPFPPPVHLLLHLGAEIDPQDAAGSTPLSIAVTNKTSDPRLMIPPLLRWGADVDVQNNDGLSPALAAIATYRTQGAMKYCRSILDCSRMLNSIVTIKAVPYTLLLFAIETRNLLAVDMLLEQGARLDLSVEREGMRYFPVFAATVARSPEEPEILTTLLRKGGDANAQLVLDSTPLHLCAAIGHNICAQILLDAEADKNMLDANGSTPLQLAIANGNPRLAKTLVAAGADVNAGTNHMSGTPLHLAIKNYEEDLLLALIRASADPTAKDDRMDTPVDMMRSLARQCLDPGEDKHSATQTNAANNQHEGSQIEAHVDDSVLVADPACHLSYLRILGLLLEKIADRDAKKFGWPPIGEEGWYEAEMFSKMQETTHARSGPRIRNVKYQYERRSLMPLPIESTVA